MKNSKIQNEINKAIYEAVADVKQDKELANRIIAWFKALSEGNENISDRATTHNRIELILKQTKINSTNDEEDSDNAN